MPIYDLFDEEGCLAEKGFRKFGVSKEEQAWAYDEHGYVHVNDAFKYKSRIVKRNGTDENGNGRTVEEKVVVYWSKKFQERGMRENKAFLEFLKKLGEAPGNFRVTAAQARSLKRFMSSEYVNIKTGEAMNASDIRGSLDFDKVSQYKNRMGYYQLVTSELTMDAREVIDKYHGLTQIEDQFRVMKGDLAARPFYVRTPEHMEAHMLICMIALVILRIIQRRIRDASEEQNPRDVYWNVGMSGERVQAALNKWKADELPDGLFRFMDVDNADLARILRAFEIDIPPKLYRRAELRSIKPGIEVFK